MIKYIMEKATSINNLTQDSETDTSQKNNSQEIDNIINKIQQDNFQIKQEHTIKPNQEITEEQLENNEEYQEEYTMYDVIYNEVSYPLLVIVLFILLSIPQIDSMLCSYISFICSESGNLNLYGILLKSLVMGLLFYIFGKYVV